MAPTNVLRDGNRGPSPAKRGRKAANREILIRAGTVAIRARLLATPTADRIWSTLPLYGTAETWGQLVHFETRAETGREPGATWTVKSGQIAYWAEQDRIVIGFGPTPISKAGEIRLQAPSSVWAIALDDVRALAAVTPGERVAVLEADS